MPLAFTQEDFLVVQNFDLNLQNYDMPSRVEPS